MSTSSSAPAVIVLLGGDPADELERVLLAAGCTVSLEGDPRSADAVVVHVRDPGRAVELCRRAAGSPSVPILVVGPADLPARELRAAGAHDVLVRPLDAETLVARVTALIRNRRLTEQLEDAPDVLAALAQAVEEKDDYTEGHGERVAVYGAALAGYVGLPPAEVEAIRVGGLLHDVGKIGTPDAILHKPAPLTPAEFEVIKRHPIDGWEVCRHVRALAGTTLDCVRHHHEKLDGSGYPDGLTGDELSVPARIVAVATVFDALATARAYKPAFPTETSFRILREEVERGWWDGALVEAFIALLREHEVGGDERVKPVRPRPGPERGPGPGPAGAPARLRPTDPPRVPPSPLSRRQPGRWP